ncbi:MAG TPA: AbrB/MazE/SpoVT family DNA-binding domain-containing protein [Caulobacteraceae bacterium]|jgi:antitoxin MazE|nr:AbrB/MazE/SpoVT family DNA-binding domain-containing protein [Caulobacteraceae bacterium]
MKVQVARWGNSLGVRLPKKLVRRVGLGEGASVEMTAENGRIVITVRREPRLDELLRGMSPQAMAEAFDWGDDRGRERAR